MTTSQTTPDAFESFNARSLSPIQVAGSFIPPPGHFHNLMLRRHSLVVGPRGSGKTTLLKMLQLQALNAWKHHDADSYRSMIDFTGIFVATDVSWGAQLQAVSQSRHAEGYSTALGLSAFTTHVLISLVDSMMSCLDGSLEKNASLARFYVCLDREREASLVQILAQSWKLRPRLSSLLALKLALRERLIGISEIAHSGPATPPDVASSFLYLGFLECVTLGVEAFNGLIGQPDRRWGLLFDELEIAPRDIRLALLQSLRSTDQRLLFKLSISPYHEDISVLDTPYSAMSGHDYQSIELWYPRKEEGYAFSASLMKAMFKGQVDDSVDPEVVFGPSEFDRGLTDRTTSAAYSPNGRLYERFKRLAGKDESFRAYLAANRVSLEGMDRLSEKRRASIIRKVTSVVAIRDAYRFGFEPEAASETEDNRRSSSALSRIERSRKNPDIFVGARSIFAIVEGNPRWLITMAGPLVRLFLESGRRVPPNVQADAIVSATNRFRALLRTIPFSNSQVTPNLRSVFGRGLIGLLDKIGMEFYNGVVVRPFSAEPPLSFTVDSTAPDDLLEALGKALNAGAIILVPDGGDTLVSSLKGKRFRLSYMLAPFYGIPLTLGRSVSLSQLLAADRQDGDLLEWSRQ